MIKAENAKFVHGARCILFNIHLSKVNIYINKYDNDDFPILIIWQGAREPRAHSTHIEQTFVSVARLREY